MSFGDANTPADRPQQAQIEQVKDEAAEPLSAEAITLLAQSSKADRVSVKDKPVEIKNQGQIESMVLPVGWKKADQAATVNTIGGRSLIEWHPPDNSDVRLSIFYRGLPVGSEASAAFRSVLKKPAHELSKEEVAALSGILRERADDKAFNLEQAKTVQLNGKIVVVIEGEYRETGSKLKELLVDADGTGAAVQEVYYQAPGGSYKDYEEQSARSFASIKWK